MRYRIPNAPDEPPYRPGMRRGSKVQTSVIDASQLPIVLAAHKAGHSRTRWCVMSQHITTQPCRTRSSAYQIRVRSLCGPMTRGEFQRSLNREAARGAKWVRATFGTGIRALRLEQPWVMERPQ